MQVGILATTSAALVAVPSLFVFLYSCTLLRTKGYGLPLPPGPRVAWWGNAAVPRERQWIAYAQEWRERYGDLIYVHMFGNPLLILNSAEVVADLFEKRSSVYSSRPIRTMIVELMGWGWLFSTLPYGPWWRRHRTLFHNHFHANTLSEYHPIQIQETHTLLRNLLESPDRFRYYIRRWGAGIVLKMAYGHQMAEEGDDYVSLADRALEGLAKAGIFGTYMVDYIPALKYVPAWMPGASFQRKAMEWKRSVDEMVERPFQMVKRAMSDGTASSCFMTTELEQAGSDPEQIQIVKDVAATTYTAGADTTVSTVASFILAMTLHPEIARKAQNELANNIGTRLPQYTDSLPYIDCICWELLRWNPVTPLGLARSTTKHDEYRGYLIPKGTTVLPNVWGILHDPKVYPEPLAFNPDRFLDAEGNTAAGINPLPQAAFGFGRRMCPGNKIAFQSVWMAVASILTVYDITNAFDDEGNNVIPKPNFTPAALSHPEPFLCQIKPRSSHAIALIRQTAEAL
ncbi:hypothetical protein HGRIS_007803 [Hohenbuehelia grisea]|uniref:Cytochrome P450 n=1 Tax=Hohenbuehelia grisea TaxID=104357 RepID=A0ABR3J5Y7_9AGAR